MRAFASSTIGKKVIMAVTGVIMVVWVFLHMAGNLQVFEGAEKIDRYGAFLQGTTELLWPMRIILLVALVLHVWAAVSLTLRNRTARPVGYREREPQVTTFAARSLKVGGVIILLFVIFHVLHFTTGTIHPNNPTFAHAAIYRNLILAFQVWWVVLIYVVAMIFLALHFYHGVWSSARTLGVTRPKVRPLQRPFALAVALIVWLGFTAVPVAIFAGLLH